MIYLLLGYFSYIFVKTSLHQVDQFLSVVPMLTKLIILFDSHKILLSFLEAFIITYTHISLPMTTVLPSTKTRSASCTHSKRTPHVDSNHYLQTDQQVSAADKRRRHTQRI